MIYKKVSLEICGKCNAQCKYCYTGRVNRGWCSPDEGGFISPNNFSHAIAYLRDKGLICPETIFRLYNYGEPLMHPYLIDILRIIDNFGYGFELSTNGSVIPQLELVPYLRNLKKLKISMCGFSQASYDLISRLSFSRVKSNIILMLKMLRDSGWNGVASLKFHVYNHNMNEVELARSFSEDLGIVFVPIHAIIGDLRMQMDYFDGQLGEQIRQEADQDLVTSRMFHEYAEKMPQNWNCPLSSELVIDEYLQLVNCCMATRSDKDDYHLLGSLFDSDGRSIKDARCRSTLGARCYLNGLGYAINSFPSYRDEEWIDSIKKILYEEDVDVIGEDDLYASFQRIFGSGGVSWHHCLNVRDFSIHGRSGNGIILADSRYHDIRRELMDSGIPEKRIRAVYNSNLR